jgi:hypothetical protein
LIVYIIIASDGGFRHMPNLSSLAILIINLSDRS